MIEERIGNAVWFLLGLLVGGAIGFLADTIRCTYRDLVDFLEDR